MIKWLLLVVAVLALVAWAFARSAAPPAGAAARARQMVEGGALLLDVRTPAEFASGHLDGAVNIPVQELSARAGEVARGRPVVVYCRSGRRSADAKRILEARGHEVLDIGAMGNY